MSAIDDAIRIAGGVRPLATRLKLSHQTVLKWRAQTLRITAERAVDLENATGIPRHAFRPDLWQQPRPLPAEAA